MISQKTTYSVSFILCFLISFDVANSAHLITDCDTTAAYNVTSPGGRLYQQNIASLFAVLYSNYSQPSGFYNYTAGGGSRGVAVNGLFLCRGDVTATECQVCLTRAITKILGSCSNVTRAITWYDECLLRYSNLPIFSKMDTEGGWTHREKNNVTDGALLNRTLDSLLPRVASEAAYGTNYPGKKFAVGDANFTAFGKIFALAQCTPDITNLECASCLADGITLISGFCNNRQGCKKLDPSCVISYSTTPFYNTVATPPLLPPPSIPPPPPPRPPMLPPPPESTPPSPDVPIFETNQTGRGTSRATVAAIVSPIFCNVVAFLVAFFIGAV